MLGVSLIQLIGSLVSESKFTAYWPYNLTIFAQILIGTSIGSRVNLEMFKELGQTFFVSLISTLGLVILVSIISVGISEISHIPLATSYFSLCTGRSS